jgi:glycine C-acetyltransferase
MQPMSAKMDFSGRVALVTGGASGIGFAAARQLAEGSDELRRRVADNSARFRDGMEALGFTLAGTDHAIIPVMLGDARLAGDMAEGIYVIGFSFPVVPRGEARIRTQMSAAHTPEQIDRAVAAFAKVGRELGVIA